MKVSRHLTKKLPPEDIDSTGQVTTTQCPDAQKREESKNPTGDVTAETHVFTTEPTHITCDYMYICTARRH